MFTESPFPPQPQRRSQGVIRLLPSQDYQSVLELQRDLCLARLEERHPDTLVLVEHSPVFTVGRRSKPEHWGGDSASLKRMGYDVHEVERGGSVTYHGPGQIVVYPILRLRDFCPGPKIYVGLLEEVLIRVLGDWGIKGQRAEKWRGVWVEQSENTLQKIAAIGVRITRGVTFHGFALNVNIDLKPFELIIPCGIEGCQVTSMELVLGTSVDMAVVREQIVHHFGEVFGLDWKRNDRENFG